MKYNQNAVDDPGFFQGIWVFITSHPPAPPSPFKNARPLLQENTASLYISLKNNMHTLWIDMTNYLVRLL